MQQAVVEIVSKLMQAEDKLGDIMRWQPQAVDFRKVFQDTLRSSRKNPLEGGSSIFTGI